MITILDSLVVNCQYWHNSIWSNLNLHKISHLWKSPILYCYFCNSTYIHYIHATIYLYYNSIHNISGAPPRWMLFHLWLRFITFGGRSAHLGYRVHKSVRKINNHHHHHLYTLYLFISHFVSLRFSLIIFSSLTRPFILNRQTVLTPGSLSPFSVSCADK